MQKKIKRNKLHINKIKKAFTGQTDFTLNDLFEYYRSFETDVPRNTVKWRAYELVRIGTLVRTGRGYYKFGDEMIYSPDTSGKIKSIFYKIKNKFPFIDYCIWSTKYFNEFMVHQPSNFITIIETESEVMESVFNFLKDNNLKIFLNPDNRIIENYIDGEKNCLIIKSLISEAPVKLIDKVKTITLEKMLVDVFCDIDLFHTFQGTEIDNIFQNALSTYSISRSKILRYASRRGKKNEIQGILEKSNQRQ